jgi:hypothetical protein
VSLSNGRFDTRNENLNYFFCFLFFHSTFDVGRSMFDVHFSVTVNGYRKPILNPEVVCQAENRHFTTLPYEALFCLLTHHRLVVIFWRIRNNFRSV